jgi:hypothetical protein
MRVVFLLYAEERRLLPLDDPVYNANYAILPMRERLEERARLSDEALAFTHGAWSQVLATTRAVYGGIQHERLRLPPYGGSLFDPDRYPFLEGRETGSRWHEAPSRPIPVDDRTMLAVLGALQQLKVTGELRSLSFRQLAVEQIGHVYEGLLDHGCVRADEVVVGLEGKEGVEPELPLARLEAALGEGRDTLVEFVVEASKLTENKVRKLVLSTPTAEDLGALSAACGHGEELTARVRPYLPLLRRDLNGLPMVFPPGAMYVTQTGQRRDSGTAYTTPELADEVVMYALEPQVYSPGPAQTADRSEWQLRNSTEILDLKVCDPAVGSGAILVAAVRYLAERLVEAWRAEIDAGQPERLLDGVPEDDWELIARRAVVDHCIYGVDRNPMAVEMAKLSLWLTTMAHDRPFTFLDHQLRSGDSLLGITDLDQLRMFHPEPTSDEARQHRFFDPKDVVEPRIQRALELAQEIAAIDVSTLRDADRKRQKQHELESELAPLTAAADALIGGMVAGAPTGAPGIRAKLLSLGEGVRGVLTGAASSTAFRQVTQTLLDTERPEGSGERRPLHWPLAYPEVFLAPTPGFDAMIGNPPYMGNKYWKERLGPSIQPFFASLLGGRIGKPDLIAVFVWRMPALVKSECGTIGTLATQSITEGDSERFVRLHVISGGARVFRSVRSRPWPGREAVFVSLIWLARGHWSGSSVADGDEVEAIGTDLRASRGDTEVEVFPLANSLFCFQGIDNSRGMALVLSADDPLARDPECRAFIRPYVSGEDLSGHDPLKPGRAVIDLTSLRSEDDLLALPQALRVFVRDVVQPTRTPEMLRSYKGLAERWWTFWNTREEGFRRVRLCSECVGAPAVAKHFFALRLPSSWAFTNKVFVFDTARADAQALLLSSIFRVWMDWRGGSLGEGQTIKVQQVVGTFPAPEEVLPDSLADEWQECVLEEVASRRCTVTEVINRIHDAAVQEEGIQRLRALQVGLDTAVALAYGWPDLELEHDHHPTEQGTRFTVSAAARDRILDLLVAENHRQHAAEVVAGLVSADGKKKVTRKRSSTSSESLF